MAGVPFLPDNMEQNARVEVLNAGTKVAKRRAIDFTSGDASVTITTTDSGVGEKVTVDLAAGGGGGFAPVGVVLFAQIDGGTFAIGSNTGTFVYAHAVAPADGSAVELAGPPAGLGVSYVLDSATPTITATVDGVWLMNAFYSAIGGGTASGDEYQINLSGPALPQAAARITTTATTSIVPPLSTSCPIWMTAGQTVEVDWQMDSAGGSGVGGAHQYFQLDITRIA